MNGIVNVYKEAGMTSFDVVAKSGFLYIRSHINSTSMQEEQVI